MFALRGVFIDKKVKVLGELARSFSQFSDSNNLITENQTTEKPFGSRLPDSSHLNILQGENKFMWIKALQSWNNNQEKLFTNYKTTEVW